MYNVQFEIELTPHGATAPEISYGLDTITDRCVLTEPTVLKIDQTVTGEQHKFIIEFHNKTNDTPDMAVEITRVTVEGMTLDRFKWANRYYPVYPEPWASEQPDPLPEFQESATYLGWNGRWEFHFNTPIFRWIHRLEKLGWIYD